MRQPVFSVLAVSLLPFALAARLPAQAPRAFTLEQILGSPFPSSLTASHDGRRLAWVFKQRGAQAIWVAEGPAFEARPLVAFDADDGRSVSIVGFSHGGEAIVFLRGGRFNPSSDPLGPAGTRLFGVAWSGGDPVEIAEASSAAISPTERKLVYARRGEVWEWTPKGGARLVVDTRGNVSDLRWSPDGSRIAFVCARESFDESYGYVSVYDLNGQHLRYLDASTHQDRAPRWSPDGQRIAFLRRLTDSAPTGLLAREIPTSDPWDIRVTDLAVGVTTSVLRGPERVSFAQARLSWRGDQRLVFRSERDGWPRLWEVRVATGGGRARAVSPAEAEVEAFAVNPKSGSVFFTCNSGDVDRRHLWVSEPGERTRQLTSGESCEWGAVPLPDPT